MVYPEINGCLVFGSGAICYEGLIPSGWTASMTLPALLNALKAFFVTIKKIDLKILCY